MNDEELEKLLEAYTDTIRAVCRKYFLIGGSDDDLFQEGMIGLLEAFRDFDKEKGGYDSEAFKRFASVCIKRQILDAIKRANTKKNQPLNNYLSFSQKNKDEKGYEMEFSVDSLYSFSAGDPEEQVLNRETTNEQLQVLEERLTKSEKDVLSLYLAGYRQSKIAQMLDKNVKFVDNTIQRIKKKAQANSNKAG